MSPLDSSSMFGMRIVASLYVLPVPKISVSPLLKWISDECRRDMDAFLLDTFGTKEVAYVFDSSYLTIGHMGRGMDTVVLHPKHLAMIRNP